VAYTGAKVDDSAPNPIKIDRQTRVQANVQFLTWLRLEAGVRLINLYRAGTNVLTNFKLDSS